MAMYREGDKVKVRQWNDMEREYGLDMCGTIQVPCSFMPAMREFCGRIVTISRVVSEDTYRIKEDDYGWVFSNAMFEVPKISKIAKALKSHKPIVIYQEDRKVIAQDIQTGKTGVARCHPDDKFDFYYGVGLAIERLTGYKPESEPEPTITREPEYYSGKVICVKSRGSFTVGKVYIIKDGILIDDEYCCFNSIEDIAWLNRHFSSKFIELVE